ncbi:rna-directed dna polymerase from mobile element jockey-like [Pitangus sulphuratus]|nr:rna-directed dna polymerase from mobile element jockey-like [Pitangus sulphuratus]
MQGDWTQPLEALLHSGKGITRQHDPKPYESQGILISSKPVKTLKIQSLLYKGRDAIQGNLDKLKKWVHEKLMTSNKTKSKMLHLGLAIPDMSTDWEKTSLRAVLQRRTWVFSWMKIWA